MRPTKRNARKKTPPSETHTAIIVVWLPPGGDGAVTSDDGGTELKGGVAPERVGAGEGDKLPGVGFGGGT